MPSPEQIQVPVLKHKVASLEASIYELSHTNDLLKLALKRCHNSAVTNALSTGSLPILPPDPRLTSKFTPFRAQIRIYGK